MKRSTRRILFWFAVFVFCLVSWVAIRYAQGYAYDWENGGFVHTGAIAVSANTDAKLFIDDRLVGSLSFLGRRAGRDHLLPGNYTVRLVRDGWSSWRKEAQVQEGLLADFPNVLLLPMDEPSQGQLRLEAQQALVGSLTLADASPTPTPTRTPVPPRPRTPTPTPEEEVRIEQWLLRGDSLFFMDTASGSLIAEDVLGFSPTDSNDRVLWWTRNELWVLWVRNTDYQPYRIEQEREMLGRWSTPVARAAWFRDRDHVVVDLGTSGYRVVETDTRGGINIIRF